MTFRSPFRFALLLAALFVCGGSAYAQGPAVGAAMTTSELEMSATVQTAVQLNISTGAGGATVSGSNSTGLFQVSFGNVNGLGLGTPAAGVSVVADASGALYKTPVNLTPVYSGFTTETATIEAEQDAAGDTALARGQLVHLGGLDGEHFDARERRFGQRERRRRRALRRRVRLQKRGRGREERDAHLHHHGRIGPRLTVNKFVRSPRRRSTGRCFDRSDSGRAAPTRGERTSALVS